MTCSKLAMPSQTTVFQDLYSGKTEISRQVSKVLLGVNRRIGGNDCQYRGRKLWGHRKDVSMEIQSACTGLGDCYTVGRSTRQGDLISIQSSVPNRLSRVA